MADRSSNKAGRSSSKHNDKDKTLDGEHRDHADDQQSKSKSKGDGPSTTRHDSPDRNAGGQSVAQGHSAVEPASASRQDGGQSEAPEMLEYEGRDYSPERHHQAVQLSKKESKKVAKKSHSRD